MPYDRFEQGLPDRQALPAAVIARCNCGCGELIHLGDEAIEHEGDYYSEYSCLLRGIGADWVNAGEE